MRHLCAMLAVLFLAPALGRASETRRLFSEFAPSVVKIQIVGERSEARSVIGTGFFVDDRGHLLTNYHVIAKAVFHPDTHHAELATEEGRGQRLRIVAVDVVHDLALVSSDGERRSPLRLASELPEQGDRIYSLGHPHDLGLSIVEGTYNGLLDESFYDKIHLTVSLNPGMSGGPTIDAQGSVIGVNVATAGNQVSFVIPAERAGQLLARVGEPDFSPVEDLREEVRSQLVAHQDQFLADVATADVLATVPLGPFDVPSDFARFLSCWGDDSDDEGEPFEVVTRQCGMRDAIFLDTGMRAGELGFEHRLVSSTELGRIRFFSLYQMMFQGTSGVSWAHNQDLTDFACDTGYVEEPDLLAKVVFCVRRYVELEGLYDIVLKAATLGEPARGLQSRLTLTGVSFEAGRAVAQRFLAAIRRRVE
jgi:hypothetical protein